MDCIMARRLTIIALFAAIFACSFSMAVEAHAGGGPQSHDRRVTLACPQPSASIAIAL